MEVEGATAELAARLAYRIADECSKREKNERPHRRSSNARHRRRSRRILVHRRPSWHVSRFFVDYAQCIDRRDALIFRRLARGLPSILAGMTMVEREDGAGARC